VPLTVWFNQFDRLSRHNKCVDAHVTELSRSIDPVELGRRIRTLRRAAGLTQTQLAQGDVSTGYISRIEIGQRRPDVGLLQKMAERLEVSVEQLVEGTSAPAEDGFRVQVDLAELSLAGGDATTALEQIGDVLASMPQSVNPSIRRSARLVKAAALEADGQLDEAIVLLEDLTQHPQADLQWVRALIALSRCHREAGDFSRAITVAEQATQVVEEMGLAGTTEAIQLAVTVAAGYIQQGDVGHAMRLCLRAIDAAEKIDSPVAKGSAYWNASVIESKRGATGAALQLAQKALALFELGEDSRNLGRLRTQVGYMQLRLDPPDAQGAKETLQRAEQELAWSAAGSLDKADHHLALGRAHLLLGEHGQVQAHVEAATALALDHSPTITAAVHSLQGQLHAASGDVEQARSAYRAAIDALNGVGNDRDVAQTWFELAQLLEEVGDASAAIDAYRRGAVSTGLATPSWSGAAARPGSR
jgi:tetratricopeptide (TPR) repeat protein